MNKVKIQNHDGSMTGEQNHDGSMTGDRAPDMAERLLEDPKRGKSCQHDGRARYITIYHMQALGGLREGRGRKKGEWLNIKGTYFAVIAVMPSWLLVRLNKVKKKLLESPNLQFLHSESSVKVTLLPNLLRKVENWTCKI